MLGVQEEDGSWSALPLSQDHNAQNEAELGRLRAQHPPSERDTVITDNRLLGVRTHHHYHIIVVRSNTVDLFVYHKKDQAALETETVVTGDRLIQYSYLCMYSV